MKNQKVMLVWGVFFSLTIFGMDQSTDGGVADKGLESPVLQGVSGSHGMAPLSIESRELDDCFEEDALSPLRRRASRQFSALREDVCALERNPSKPMYDRLMEQIVKFQTEFAVVIAQNSFLHSGDRCSDFFRRDIKDPLERVEFALAHGVKRVEDDSSLDEY